MQAPRLNEVLTRVVAWHNRHPLARRISPTQVHSIGEVLLPFASSESAPAARLDAPGLPMVGDLLDPPQASAPAGFSAEIGALAEPPATEAPSEQRAAVRQAAADSGALDLDTDIDPDLAEASPFSLAEADRAALAAESARTNPAQPGAHVPDPHADLSLPLGPPDPSDPQRRSTDQPAAHSAGPLPPRAEAKAATAPAQAGTSPFAAALAARAAGAPASKPAAPVGPLRRLWARLPGRRSTLPRLQAVFSRDFIWPLSPRQIAGWVPPRPVAADRASRLASARGRGRQQHAGCGAPEGPGSIGRTACVDRRRGRGRPPAAAVDGRRRPDHRPARLQPAAPGCCRHPAGTGLAVCRLGRA